MICADGSQNKTTLEFCLVGTTSRTACKGGHVCEHVMGLGGLPVHIHPNLCLGVPTNVHPWFVHHYRARAHGLCIPEQVSAHPPVLCMDRYLWGVCL